MALPVYLPRFVSQRQAIKRFFRRRNPKQNRFYECTCNFLFPRRQALTAVLQPVGNTQRPSASGQNKKTATHSSMTAMRDTSTRKCMWNAGICPSHIVLVHTSITASVAVGLFQQRCYWPKNKQKIKRHKKTQKDTHTRQKTKPRDSQQFCHTGKTAARVGRRRAHQAKKQGHTISKTCSTLRHQQQGTMGA